MAESIPNNYQRGSTVGDGGCWLNPGSTTPGWISHGLPTSATPELSLEKALLMVKEQHEAHVATALAINTTLLSYWMSQHIQS